MNLNLNYYTILGVNHQSTEKEIKKAYYNLSKEHHPYKVYSKQYLEGAWRVSYTMSDKQYSVGDTL